MSVRHPSRYASASASSLSPGLAATAVSRRPCRSSQQAGTRYGAPFAFLAFTGCRRGEVLELVWGDVDLIEGQVSIRRTITLVDGKLHRSGSTKRGQGRSIRLQPELGLTTRSTPRGSSSGGRGATGCRRSGCTTFATDTRLALAAGVPAKVVADQLAHGSVMITLDLYSHVIRRSKPTMPSRGTFVSCARGEGHASDTL